LVPDRGQFVTLMIEVAAPIPSIANAMAKIAI
jgi:hypothetical protein